MSIENRFLTSHFANLFLSHISVTFLVMITKEAPRNEQNANAATVAGIVLTASNAAQTVPEGYQPQQVFMMNFIWQCCRWRTQGRAGASTPNKRPEWDVLGK